MDKNIGLTSSEAQDLLKKYGENRLKEGKTKSFFVLFIEQFKSILIAILILASILSIIIGEMTEGIVILLIVVLNAFVGAKQEAGAGNALKALKDMASPEAKVIRDSKLVKLSSNLLVPNDLVIIEAGDYIPADLELIETVNLKIQESALTGESISVEKDANIKSNDDSPIAERLDTAFSGTFVTYGRGKGIVKSTGMKTEIGKIAGMLDEKDEQTPLQERLDKLGRHLGILCIIVSVIIFGLGYYRGMDVMGIFMIAISLAVAAIPEGLPAIVTVVLAIGMKNMVKKNVIVKSLGSVETLGSTTVICSDKTGTLTQNKMNVKNIYDGKNIYNITGDGYLFEGEITNSKTNEKISEKEIENIKDLMLSATLCNDAKIDKEKDSVIGDPTEGAFLIMAAKAGFIYDEIQEKYPRLSEYPFDSVRKMMSTSHNIDGEITMFTKGAPDSIFEICSHIEIDGKICEFNEYLNEIKQVYEDWASKALRVLCFAKKSLDSENELENRENNMIFCGMTAMIDPPRESAKNAIKECNSAGIRVAMITGDHALTASAIGKEIGILSGEQTAITGTEINEMSDDKFLEYIDEVNVYSRVAPEHKVKIVDALKSKGNIVAMTGDGVNDAPSLKKADIGIAMGITGTDVSKEASNMILTDDNFASIVEAVKEGRVIYSNIRKFVSYLISCNVGEILLIFVAMILGWGSPLTAIQLLWVNLITDSLPAFALGLEPAEEGVMNRMPRDPEENIIDKKMKISVVFQSIGLAFATLLSFRIGYMFYPLYANTFAFITLISGELLRAFSGRSEDLTLIHTGLFRNKYLNIAVIVSYGLSALLLVVPFLRNIFELQDIGEGLIILAIIFSIIPLIFGEISKKFKISN